MVDFLGKELKTGDTVVFMQKGYRQLMKGTIRSMSALKVTLSHEPTNTCSIKTIQFGDQTVKV